MRGQEESETWASLERIFYYLYVASFKYFKYFKKRACAGGSEKCTSKYILETNKSTPTPARRSETTSSFNIIKNYKLKKIAGTSNDKYVKYKREGGGEELSIEKYLKIMKIK